LVVDKGLQAVFTPEDKHRFQVRIDRVKEMLGVRHLRHPRETLRRLVKERLTG